MYWKYEYRTEWKHWDLEGGGGGYFHWILFNEIMVSYKWWITVDVDYGLLLNKMWYLQRVQLHKTQIYYLCYAVNTDINI